MMPYIINYILISLLLSSFLIAVAYTIIVVFNKTVYIRMIDSFVLFVYLSLLWPVLIIACPIATIVFAFKQLDEEKQKEKA